MYVKNTSYSFFKVERMEIYKSGSEVLFRVFRIKSYENLFNSDRYY